MSLRFLVTILTIIVIAIGAGIGVFLAKGYRFSTEDATFKGTGIMSITSIPDQASVYLDGHLTTATNANINSLVPKTYNVKIVKEGFIPWEKKVDIKEGLVSEIKATLFPAIPTIYPLSYNGVVNPTLSPDGLKLVFVVPGNAKKSGIWVWTMAERPIAFARGAEPHQIAEPSDGLDYTKATFKFSPDANQVMVNLPDRTLLLDLNTLVDPPRDITATVKPTLDDWEEEVATKNAATIQAIKDLSTRKIASVAANLAWSPDEKKFLYSDKTPIEASEKPLDEPEEKIKYKVTDLTTKKTYTLPEANFATWLANSTHILLVKQNEPVSEDQPSTPYSTISVVELDGGNEAIIYAGNFDPRYVFPWPDASRAVLVTTFPTPTAQTPNLYGVNLK